MLPELKITAFINWFDNFGFSFTFRNREVDVKS